MTESTNIEKLPYHAPVLEVYGTMAELTAADPAGQGPFDGGPGAGYVAGVS
jgi:hypothetical protein